MAALFIPLAAASDKAALDQRVEASRNVIDEIMQTPDKSIPTSVMQKATCIAVVPSFKKGAFIVGAQYGQGVVTCRTGQGWSGPVLIRMEDTSTYYGATHSANEILNGTVPPPPGAESFVRAVETYSRQG
jgi:SH3 domain-containing YSC84-like protein 1